MSQDDTHEKATSVAFDPSKVEVFGNDEGKTKLWVHGRVVDHPGVQFSAKVYDVGSDFGINGGRVSKLQVYEPEEGRFGSKLLFAYDRGWPEDHMGVPQVPPEGRERAILQTIVDGFADEARPQMNDQGPSFEGDELEL